jgi:hypothetical protein
VLLKCGDEGRRLDLERVAIWAQQSAEQAHFLAMIEWADVLENGAGFGIGVAADPAKARDALALSAEFKTKQNNLWMTSIRSATVSEAPIKVKVNRRKPSKHHETASILRHSLRKGT